MTAKEIRKSTWDTVKANLVPSILAALICLVLGGLLISAAINFTFKFGDITYNFPAFHNYIISWLGIGTLMTIVQFILGGPIRQGYAAFLLKQHDGETPDFKVVFSRMNRFGAGFCLKLLESLYIILWALLFIIPGIVAGYRYAMAPFLMEEDPEMTASEAISASKKLMNGHKWELFGLDISFFGWVLLSCLTLGLGAIVLNPWLNAARAKFYRNLCPTNVPAAEPVYLPEE